MSPGKATAGITVVNSALGFLSSDFYSSLDSDWFQNCVLPPEWGCALELAQGPWPIPKEGPESEGDGGTRWQVDLACRGGTGRAVPRPAPPSFPSWPQCAFLQEAIQATQMLSPGLGVRCRGCCKQGQMCGCDLGCSGEAWVICWFVSFTS